MAMTPAVVGITTTMTTTGVAFLAGQQKERVVGWDKWIADGPTRNIWYPIVLRRLHVTIKKHDNISHCRLSTNLLGADEPKR